MMNMPKTISRRLGLILFLSCFWWGAWAQQWQYVDPRIGSVGVGRTFPGPSMPFGMVKPGPDCGVRPNAGWAPMPEPVTGFSQTHVSGTGGGQKYGNILIQPSLDDSWNQVRTDEHISLGYYATTYANGIRTEITTAEKCAFYRFHYPRSGNLLIDVSHFLGKSDIPDLREAQQLVGAEMEVVEGCQVRGYSTVRGGWNNGDAYTKRLRSISATPVSASRWASLSSAPCRRQGMWRRRSSTSSWPTCATVGNNCLAKYP